MPEQAEKTYWTAVYLNDEHGRNGEPAALFRDGRHANEYRRLHGDARSVVVTSEDPSTKANADVRAALAPPAPAAGAPADGAEAADEVLRARIRSEEAERRRVEAIRKEVNAELDEAEKDAEKAERAAGGATKTAAKRG